MRIYSILILGLLAISLLTNCASSKSKGFNRGEVYNKMNEVTVSDKNIEDTLKLKPQLPKNFKLGVFFTEPKTVTYYTPKIRWTADDKEAFINDLEEKLVKTKKVSKIVTINTSIAGNEKLDSIRLAAAQHGVDAVMIIRTVNQIKRLPNHWAWSYLAVAPAFFVKGNVSKSLVISRAAMWDVRNQFLYMTAESESVDKLAYPLFDNNEETLIGETKKASFSELGAEVSKQFKEML